MVESETIYERLRAHFRETGASFSQKILFCPGTAPMKRGRSELFTILYSTDFDVAYLVDPGYVDSVRLQWDLDDLSEVTENSTFLREKSQLQLDEQLEVRFHYEGKERRVIFVAGDARRHIPSDFNVYFSGSRVCINDEDQKYGIKSIPSQHLDEIVKQLPVGGLFFPDRDIKDDFCYFGGDPQRLGLQEIPGIRKNMVLKERNLDKEDRLFSKYYREAVRLGKIRPNVAEETHFSLFNVHTLSNDRFESIEAFFKAHPEIDRTKCVEDEFGLILPVLETIGNYLALAKVSQKAYNPAEQAVIESIRERCWAEAQVEKLVRGVSLYQKI